MFLLLNLLEERRVKREGRWHTILHTYHPS
jgi:hypothetical protein